MLSVPLWFYLPELPLSVAIHNPAHANILSCRRTLSFHSVATLPVNCHSPLFKPQRTRRRWEKPKLDSVLSVTLWFYLPELPLSVAIHNPAHAVGQLLDMKVNQQTDAKI